MEIPIVKRTEMQQAIQPIENSNGVMDFYNIPHTLASPVLKTSLLRQSLQARLCCPRPSLTTRSMSKDAPLPTAPEKVKIALCQLLTTADKEKNIQTAREAIKAHASGESKSHAPNPACSLPSALASYCLVCAQTAAANGAKLVVLPEMFNCPYANESFPVYAEDIDGGNCPSVDALAQKTSRPKRPHA
eukprot:292160-Pelagomonas_calceolata.AAC.3